MLVAVVTVPSVVVAILSTPVGGRIVTASLTRILSGQHVIFSAARLRFDPLQLRVRADDISIASDRNAPPLLTVEHLDADVGALALAGGRYVVESLTAHGVKVHYVVDESGRDNLPGTREPSTATEPLDYLVLRANVTNVAVRYEDRSRQLELVLPVQSVELDGEAATGRHRISLRSGGGSIRASGRVVAVDSVEAAVELGRDDVRVEHAVVEAERSVIRLRGQVQRFADPLIELRIGSSMSLDRIAALAGIPETVAGSLTVDARASGAASSPQVDARIEGRGLGYRSVSGITVSGRLRYDGIERVASAEAMSVRASWGSIGAEGALALGDGRSRVSIRARDVDVSGLSRALQTPDVAASRIDAEVRATWPGLDYLAASGAADVRLTPEVPSSQALPMGGRLTAVADAGKLEIQIASLQAAATNVSGRVTVHDRSRLEGRLLATVTDIQAAGAALRPGQRIPASGSLSVLAEVAGTVAAPSARAAIFAPHLTLPDGASASASGEFSYRADAVTVERFDAALDAAHAHATGQVQLSGARPLTLDVSVDALEVPVLLSLAGRNRTGATGVLRLAGHVEGTVAQPEGTIAIAASDLGFAGESWGALVGDLTLADRRLTIERLLLDKEQTGGRGRVSLTGEYGLDTRTFIVDVTADDLALTGFRLPDGRVLTAGVDATAHGEGSLDAPAGHAALSLRDVEVGPRELGSLDVRAHVAEQTASIEMSADRFGLAATAAVATEAPYAGRVTATVTDLDVANLPVDTPAPLTGRFSGRVDAEGDIQDWRDARAAVQIDELEGTWNGQPFELDQSASLSLEGGELAISGFTLTAGASTVSATGQLPLQHTKADADARAITEGLVELAVSIDLPSIAGYVPALAAWDLDGVVGIAGALRGSLEAIDPTVRLDLENGAAVNRRLGRGLHNLSIHAAAGGGELSLESLEGHWDGATVEAAGQVPFAFIPALPVVNPLAQGAMGATMHARVSTLELATLPGAPERLSGSVALEFDATARAATLDALDATLSFSELNTAYGPFGLAQQQPTTIRVNEGRVTIAALELSGTAGSFVAGGVVDLAGERAMSVTAQGAIEAALLTAVADGVTAAGRLTIDATAVGTIANPELTGTIAASEVSVALDEPTLAAERITARIELMGNRVQLSSLTAALNGGDISASGSLTIRDGGVHDIDARVSGTDVAFDAPLELRSLSDSQVTLTERDGHLELEGTVELKEAGLTGDVNFDTGLLATLTAPRSIDLTEERNPLVERTRLNVQVRTATPILVDNNIATAEITTDLRIVGTPYDTGLSGTLTVGEGSEVTLNERRYEVERGTITFLDDRRIVPSFDLSLKTEANNYDVTLAVTGEPGNTETTLTSDPVLPEPDIMALLVTGRTLDEMRGEEYDVAREQVLSYLVGRVGSSLGRGIERATGLSEVRLEPALIANETDPGARLTVGQDLTDALKLVYSTDLADSNDEIWVARYDLTRRFQTNVVRQSDGTYRFDFRHDVRTGGRAAPQRLARTRPTVTSLDVDGDVEPDAGLLDRLGLEVGQPYDYFAARDGVRRVERALQDQGYLQARVRLEREPQGEGLGLVLRVHRGPKVTIRYEGLRPPDRVDADVKRQWNRGIFDVQRGHDTGEVLTTWLVSERYLAGTVRFVVDDSNSDVRQVVFTIAPGARFDRLELVFDGASGIPAGRLNEIIEDQKLEQQLFRDPFVVTELLRRFYRESGYLVAAIDPPRVEFVGATARVVLEVREGPRFTVRQVAFAGNAAIDTDALLRSLPLQVGDPFLPSAAERSLEHVRDQYWRRAYNDVRSEYELRLDRLTGEVDVTLRISEGARAVVADVRVEGTERVNDSVVRDQLDVSPAQPLDLAALGRSRRNLYETGAFSVVDITREPLTADQTASGGTNGQKQDDKDVRIQVAVREVQPFQIRYGGSFDTERGLGAIADVSSRNVLGALRLAGVSGRYDASLREGRLYMQQPKMRSWPTETTASVYYREERNARTRTGAAFNVERFGVSIQQERTLRNHYLWTYGYRYERARRFAPGRGDTVAHLRVAPVVSTLTRDSRDDILDATTGSFNSHALSFSPSWLGADSPYLKYYGQFFQYVPLQPPERKPFTNEMLRPRLVFATGVRLGLAWGPAGRIPETERFFAGGSTTMRGFDQNALGATASEGVPAGGNALLILNNELRVPLFGPLDGVGFLDVGTVFDRVSDITWGRVRQTTGVGLRLRTPWFLLRSDYGVVLDPVAGEPRSRVYFSIGQAF